jgi:hypothetical protein
MVSSLMQNRFEFPTPPQATKRRAKNPPKYQLHTPSRLFAVIFLDTAKTGDTIASIQST